MKRTVLSVISVAMFVLSSASIASTKYECWTYVNGKPDKMTKIVASSKSSAQDQAPSKFRDLGARFDYIKCH